MLFNPHGCDTIGYPHHPHDHPISGVGLGLVLLFLLGADCDRSGGFLFCPCRSSCDLPVVVVVTLVSPFFTVFFTDSSDPIVSLIPFNSCSVNPGVSLNPSMGMLCMDAQ